MDAYLVFRLYGPMAAWGDVAVGEYRPSTLHPGKSALLGLLAAAAGVRREDEETHRHMADGYGVTVAVHAAGTLLRDYHTAQVPPQQRGRIFRTRRDELSADRVGTILSARDYRTDALYDVAIRRRGDDAPFELEALGEFLRRPRFALYLGRKSCPPAAPLQPQLITAEDAASALAEASFEPLPGLPCVARSALHWDEGERVGRAPLKTFARRDVPLSRRRWQFAERPEHWAPAEGEE